ARSRASPAPWPKPPRAACDTRCASCARQWRHGHEAFADHRSLSRRHAGPAFRGHRRRHPGGGTQAPRVAEPPAIRAGCRRRAGRGFHTALVRAGRDPRPAGRRHEFRNGRRPGAILAQHLPALPHRRWPRKPGRNLMKASLIALIAGVSLAASAAPPAGWMVAGNAPQDYEYGTEVQPADGSRAAFIKSKPASEGKGFGTLMQMVGADEYRGGRWKLSARIRTADAHKAQMWMRVDGP